MYPNKCMADGQQEHTLNTPKWVSVREMETGVEMGDAGKNK